MEEVLEESPIECCKVCGRDIQTMCFKGTGVCGEQCNKFLKGEAD